MNELRKEENPTIPRQSHGTRRTVESKHSAAEPRNEENHEFSFLASNNMTRINGTLSLFSLHMTNDQLVSKTKGEQ